MIETIPASPPDLRVRDAVAADAAPIAGIYNHYVAETVVTFEEEPVPPAEMAARIQDVRSAALPWIVLEHEGAVTGYAYASKWKGRCAYRFSVEGTIYLAPSFAGRGAGTVLYRRLLAELKETGLHSVLGGIALPNEASVGLHEKLGFQKVAHLREVGFKFGRWVDVGYWQLLL